MYVFTCTAHYKLQSRRPALVDRLKSQDTQNSHLLPISRHGYPIFHSFSFSPFFSFSIFSMHCLLLFLMKYVALSSSSLPDIHSVSGFNSRRHVSSQDGRVPLISSSSSSWFSPAAAAPARAAQCRRAGDHEKDSPCVMCFPMYCIYYIYSSIFNCARYSHGTINCVS